MLKRSLKKAIYFFMEILLFVKITTGYGFTKLLQVCVKPLQIMAFVKGGQSFLCAFIPFLNICKGSVQQDLSLSDEDNAAGKGLDILHIVSGQDHGGLFFLIQFQDKISDSQLGHSVQTDGRLVQKQDFGVVKKGSGRKNAGFMKERKSRVLQI